MRVTLIGLCEGTLPGPKIVVERGIVGVSRVIGEMLDEEDEDNDPWEVIPLPLSAVQLQCFAEFCENHARDPVGEFPERVRSNDVRAALPTPQWAAEFVLRWAAELTPRGVTALADKINFLDVQPMSLLLYRYLAAVLYETTPAEARQLLGVVTTAVASATSGRLDGTP